MDKNPSMLKATAIGGLVPVVVTVIPYLGECLTLLCCSPLIGGGFLAAYIYSRDVAKIGGSFSIGTGTAVGMTTGVAYTVIRGVIGFVLSLSSDISREEQIEMVRERFESQDGFPPEAMDTINSILDFLVNLSGFWIAMLMLGVTLSLGLVFCTIGGLIGGAVFKKDPPTAAPAAPEAPQVGAE